MTIPPILDKNGNQYYIGCRYKDTTDTLTLAWHPDDLMLYAIDREGNERSITRWGLENSEIIIEKGCPFDA